MCWRFSGPISAYVAVTDRRIGSSEASVEHPTDRIRNAASEKTRVTSGQGDVGDYM